MNIRIIYLLSYLDRINIANANVAGLEQDIDLTPQQYRWQIISFSYIKINSISIVGHYQFFLSVMLFLIFHQILFYVDGDHRNGLL